MRKLRGDEIELQIAFQCAPLITGLKESNLLNIKKQDYLFQKYEHSREKLIQLLSYGMRIEEIIAICSNTEIWQLVDCDCQYAS